MTNKTTFFVEVTDTFGGEANYCWVHRYRVHATTQLGAIGMVSRHRGENVRSDGGDRYNVKGACICYFIYHLEEENVKHYTLEVLGTPDPVKPTVLIFVDGGVVQDVQISFACNVIVLDADTEGCDEHTTTIVKGEEVYVMRFNPDPNPDWVNEYLKNLE